MRKEIVSKQVIVYKHGDDSCTSKYLKNLQASTYSEDFEEKYLKMEHAQTNGYAHMNGHHKEER